MLPKSIVRCFENLDGKELTKLVGGQERKQLGRFYGSGNICDGSSGKKTKQKHLDTQGQW